MSVTSSQTWHPTMFSDRTIVSDCVLLFSWHKRTFDLSIFPLRGCLQSGGVMIVLSKN